MHAGDESAFSDHGPAPSDLRTGPAPSDLRTGPAPSDLRVGNGALPPSTAPLVIPADLRHMIPTDLRRTA
jgi:hypothetical protein